MSLYRPDLQELWTNARDSIAHALDHFSEFSATRDKSRQWHHGKWIILSVYHAADKVLKMMLKDLDPNDSHGHFTDRQGHPKNRMPALMETRTTLLKYEGTGRLKASEVKLLDLIRSLSHQRHEIEHRNPPSNIDPSIAAWSILAILRVVSLRFTVATKDIFDQDPPIERDVFQAINFQHYDEYNRFIEAVLKEQYPDGQYFDPCPVCEVRAVYSSRCEACFEEVSCETCTSCGAEFFVPLDRELPWGTVYKCPQCGTAVP